MGAQDGSFKQETGVIHIQEAEQWRGVESGKFILHPDILKINIFFLAVGNSWWWKIQTSEASLPMVKVGELM